MRSKAICLHQGLLTTSRTGWSMVLWASEGRWKAFAGRTCEYDALDMHNLQVIWLLFTLHVDSSNYAENWADLCYCYLFYFLTSVSLNAWWKGEWLDIDDKFQVIVKNMPGIRFAHETFLYRSNRIFWWLISLNATFLSMH